MEPSRSKATSTATGRNPSARTTAPLAFLGVSCAMALTLASGCGATHSDSSGAQAGTAAAGTPVQTTGGGGAATGGVTNAGGSTAAAGTPSSGGTGSGAVGGSGGVASVPPACNFETPQCPNTHAPCAELGVVQDCFYWQTCHSAPGQAVCCDSGWERGLQCPSGAGGTGGAGGVSSDACGGCDLSNLEICVFQQGGPGAGHYACARQDPCAAAGVCACIVAQGTCTYEASGTPASCVCDNGLD